MKLVSVISFRYTVVSGLNPNALEPAYHEAAKAVLDGKATNLETLFERLEPIYVDDGKFRNDFALLSLDTGGQRKEAGQVHLGPARRRCVRPVLRPRHGSGHH